MFVQQTPQGATLLVGWHHKPDATKRHSASTVCFIKNELGEEVAMGVSHVNASEGDVYNRNKGRKVSMARAIEKYERSVRKVFWQAYFTMRHGNY